MIEARARPICDGDGLIRLTLDRDTTSSNCLADLCCLRVRGDGLGPGSHDNTPVHRNDLRVLGDTTCLGLGRMEAQRTNASSPPP